MKTTMSTVSEQKTYMLGRMAWKVEENVCVISFENGFNVSFDNFVSTLFNESKDYSFRVECDKIRKSKSQKKKQDFVDRNKEIFIDIMLREIPLIFTV